MKGNKLTITTLKAKEWCDKDEVLIHAAFQLLVDFVEKEKAGEVIDWTWNNDVKQAWYEIHSLYKWWKEIRPARKDPLMDEHIESPPFEFEKIPDSKYVRLVDWDREDHKDFADACEESVRLEKEWNEEDSDNLHRLVNIRSYLWT